MPHKVLMNGRVVMMDDAEYDRRVRRGTICGGDDWDKQHDEVETLRTYERMLRSMDLDGWLFHRRVSGRVCVPATGRMGDEVTFEELFELPEYWG